MRNIIGLIVGTIIAALLIYLIVAVAQAGIPQSFASVAATANPGAPDPIALVPLRAKLLVSFGFFLGALAGALAADVIAGRGVIGWAVAGLVVVLSLGLGLQIPHPTWMSVAGVVGPLLGGFLARRVARVPL